MTQITRRLREAQIALMLLTRLPAGQITGKAPGLLHARWAFPWVGLPVALLCWAAHGGALALGASPLLAAGLAFGAMALVTGALHFDGLADFADGIGGGRDKAHCLEIMRDSRIGSYGVLAMLGVALLWVSALEMLGSAGLCAFAVAAVVSRGAMVALLETLPAARADGLGSSASGRSRAARLSLGGAVAFAVLVMGWPGALAVVAAGSVAALIAWRAVRRIGGQTGDVLGAVQLSSETAIWVALALAG